MITIKGAPWAHKLLPPDSNGKKFQTPYEGLPIKPENLSAIQFSWKNVLWLNNVPGTLLVSLFQTGERSYRNKLTSSIMFISG